MRPKFRVSQEKLHLPFERLASLGKILAQLEEPPKASQYNIAVIVREVPGGPSVPSDSCTSGRCCFPSPGSEVIARSILFLMLHENFPTTIPMNGFPILVDLNVAWLYFRRNIWLGTKRNLESNSVCFQNKMNIWTFIETQLYSMKDLMFLQFVHFHFTSQPTKYLLTLNPYRKFHLDDSLLES